MLVEPLLGYPKEYKEFVDSLEAPYEGTIESKRKAQSDMLAQFGLSLDTVAKRAGKVEGKKAKGGDKDAPKKRRRTAKPFGADERADKEARAKRP